MTKMLLTAFLAFVIFAPLRTEAALSQHHMRPYQIYYGTSYNGDAERTFHMMSNTYTYGFTKTGYSAATACYDLDGKVSTVSFTVGHLDGGDTPDCDMKIYLDDEYQSQSMKLTKDMINASVTLNTAGKKKLTIVLEASNGDYGIANITQNSMHNYTSKVTKIVTAKESGIRQYTCIDCGNTYTETIPARTYCDPYLMPYQATNLTKVNEEEGSSTCFYVMGDVYYKGLKKTGYSAGSAAYNLNNLYNKVTFTVGHLDGGDTPNATLKYFVDGVEIESIPLNSTMTDQVITVSNLASAMQLKIEISASNGDYAIINMKGDLRNSAPKPHTYVDEVTLEAQIGAPGIITHRCSVCGAFYTSSTAAITYSLLDDKAAVSLEDNSCVYNGKEWKPAAIVTYEGNKLTEGVDYTVSYSNNIKAGTAVATISGTGNYSGSVKMEFKIAKAKQTFTVSKKTISIKYKKVKTAKRTVKALTVKKNKGALSYKKVSGSKKLTVNKKTGKITIAKKTKKGTYKVKIKITAKATANYRAAAKTVLVTVKVK